MPLQHSKWIHLSKYGYFKAHRPACHGAFGERITIRELEQEIGLKGRKYGEYESHRATIQPGWIHSPHFVETTKRPVCYIPFRPALIIPLIAGLSCVDFHQSRIVLNTSFLMIKPQLGKSPSRGVAQRVLQDNETIKWNNLTRINITKVTFFPPFSFSFQTCSRKPGHFPVLFALMTFPVFISSTQGTIQLRMFMKFPTWIPTDPEPQHAGEDWIWAALCHSTPIHQIIQ